MNAQDRLVLVSILFIVAALVLIVLILHDTPAWHKYTPIIRRGVRSTLIKVIRSTCVAIMFVLAHIAMGYLFLEELVKHPHISIRLTVPKLRLRTFVLRTRPLSD